MNVQTLKQKIVAEVCHPARPFCPFLRQSPLGDGITYVAFDIRGIARPDNIVMADHLSARPVVRCMRMAKDGTLPLKRGSVSEMYLSVVTAGAAVPPAALCRLVCETHKALESGGYLIFFNGYLLASTAHTVQVDFTGGRSLYAPGTGINPGECRNPITASLNLLFRPLQAGEQVEFLYARRITRAHELEPGRNLAVLVRKDLGERAMADLGAASLQNRP